MARVIEHQVQFAEAVAVRSHKVTEAEQWRGARGHLLAGIGQALALFADLQDAAGLGNVPDQLPDSRLPWGLIGRRKKHQE
jgi:hypothetical protein